MKLKLVIVWLVIALPLGWGVAKSLQKSRPLFGGGITAAPAVPPR